MFFFYLKKKTVSISTSKKNVMAIQSSNQNSGTSFSKVILKPGNGKLKIQREIDKIERSIKSIQEQVQPSGNGSALKGKKVIACHTLIFKFYFSVQVCTEVSSLSSLSNRPFK